MIDRGSRRCRPSGPSSSLSPRCSREARAQSTPNAIPSTPTATGSTRTSSGRRWTRRGSSRSTGATSSATTTSASASSSTTRTTCCARRTARPAHRPQLPGHAPVQLRHREPGRRRPRPARRPHVRRAAARFDGNPQTRLREQVGPRQARLPGLRLRRRPRQVAHHEGGARLRRSRSACRSATGLEQRGRERGRGPRLLVLAAADRSRSASGRRASSASRSTAATAGTRRQSTTILPLEGRARYADGNLFTYGGGVSWRVLEALDLVAETYGTYSRSASDADAASR